MVKLTSPMSISRCIWHSLGIERRRRNRIPHRVPLHHTDPLRIDYRKRLFFLITSRQC